MNKYLNQFLGFRCAGDVINAVTPVNKMAKELTEAMAVWYRLRKFTLKEPGRYSVMDACAGNGLVGILSVFTLPVKQCIAFDKRLRTRPPWTRGAIERWEYRVADIHNDFHVADIICDLGKDIILAASHPCAGLAERCVELFNRLTEIKGLVFLPCCIRGGSVKGFPRLLSESSLSKYELWGLRLLEKCQTDDKDLYHDKNVLSPANCVLWARKDVG